MSEDEKVIVSYYRWMQNGLKPESIDVSLITHLIVGFLVVEDDGSIGEGETHGPQTFKAVVGLKKKNPKLKVLFSVGGGGNDGGFTRIIADETLTEKFVKSAIVIIQDYSFDGIDLDWEFPSTAREKTLFVVLLQKLKDALDKCNSDLLLTIAVPAQSVLVHRGYDVPVISKIVDLVLIMTYDLHVYKWYLPFTGHNAPLHPRKREFSYFKTLNINSSAMLWMELGLPKAKLVVGLPTYGLSWKLLTRRWTGPWSPSTGGGENGGYVTYPKVLNIISTNSGKAFWDSVSFSPYVITSDNKWISYDDEDSIRAKVKFIREKQFAGVMSFSLNCDDWNGECGRESFPLHKTIHSEMMLVDKL